MGKDALTNQVNGKTVINFSVAHTEKFKDGTGNQKERTIWVEAAYWTDKTGVVPYLKKGAQVYIEGTPDIRTYTSQAGVNGASITCRVNSIQLLGGGERQGQQPQAPAQAQQQSQAYQEPDDLPF